MVRYIIWISLILSLLACNKKEEKVRPEIKTITESVYSSVTIQPDSVYQAYASINGILDKNLIEEGDLVQKGDVLLQVINTNPKINAENARLSLDLAQRNFNGNSTILQDIEKQISAAALTNSNDSINYYRQKNLWNQQIGSKIEFDTKKLKYDLSKNTLIQLQDRYQRTKDELLTQLKQAQNHYTSSLINSGDFSIKSRINGKVYALYKNPGEIVNTLEPLALIGSASVFVIEMLVDEVDIVKIREEQDVVVTLDAYNGNVFKAKVYKIYPKKDERNQTFVVEAIFESAPEVLYPGLAGEANIIISQKKNALTIPKQYLIDENKVLTSKGIVTIEIGLESLDRVEVLSGITDSTIIHSPEK